jgi:D-glycero-alpha-D-manno-heptose-7-phosphate kinase
VRISFGGGGTDLPAYYQRFGGCVLSAAINKYFYTVLQKRSDGKIQVISSDLRAVETWQDIRTMSVSGTELEIPLSVLKHLDCEVSINLFLASEIPPGTGLGSSASVCVNVLKTLTTYLRKPLSKYELAEQAYYIAREVLRKPVGKQDEYAATFGGVNFIQFHPDETTEVQSIAADSGVLRDLQASLMLFFTGASHDSWEILMEQQRVTAKEHGLAVESLHEIRDLGRRMSEVLARGELTEFAALLHEGWEAKKRVSRKISTPHIDSLYEAARSAGALGGKITGAGGGGFLLLFCEPPQQAAVRQAVTALGAREMSFEFDMNGAQVVANDPFVDADDTGGSLWTFQPANSVSIS